METATNFGGPFVMMSESLAPAWVEAMKEAPDPEKGLYGEVCGTMSLMHELDFQGREVLRLGEDPSG
ncbi:MAG: hypothetical protein ACJAQT_004016 [Akkermansiaceae bacterium]|jgi:hypothetical protein